MRLTFNDRVYLVKGIAKSCIYDFNNHKLYSVNSKLAEKLTLIENGECLDDCDEPELIRIFDRFLHEGILKQSEKYEKHDIDEIRYAESPIMFAWIEITNQCNLRCKHCYNESDIHCMNKMSLSQFCKVIDILKDMHIEKIQIIGGEPFFDKLLLKSELDYAIGKFQYIEIFTNGTLFPDDWYEYFAQNNIRIALSVYSYDENEHDKVTGVKGSWNKTNHTIGLLKKYGIKYRVCNILMKDVDLGIKNNDLYELSKEKDVVRMSGRGNFNLLTDELIKKRLITKETFSGKLSAGFCRNLVTGHNCFNSKLYVAADMNVYPCVMERRLKHCNITECGGIILDESIRKLNKDKIEECKCCEFRYACFDCRPNSLSNKILVKPWYCTYNAKTGEWANVDDFIKKLKEEWKG